jgi:hypothetical protein
VQYRNTVRMAKDRPLLGVGPGNWPVAYPRYTTPGDPAYHAGTTVPTNPWPSGDWIALLAERGAPALALLVLGGVVLAAGSALAVARREAGRAADERRDAGLAALSQLAALLVMGTFDAVLLLAAPTFAVWTLQGALAPVGAERVAWPERLGRPLVWAVALAGIVLAGRSTMQLLAMRAATRAPGATGLARAARLDPFDYRVRLLLAEHHRRAGRCDRARPHAEAARDLFPSLPAPKAVLRACGRGRSRGKRV